MFSGRATLFTDQNKAKLEWGASIVEESAGNRAVVGDVNLIRLNDFVLQIVSKTRLDGQQKEWSL
jgi:hypothetical protein